MLSSDQVAALGAFLSGVGSILTARWYIRRAKKQAKSDCDERLAEYDKALHEGIEIEKDRQDTDRARSRPDPGSR